jgi:hypothetical protein
VTTRKDIILELRYLQMIQKQTGHFMVQISGLLKVKLFPFCFFFDRKKTVGEIPTVRTFQLILKGEYKILTKGIN